MSNIQLTRHQQRQLQKLADRVDRVTQADRRFFERFPHRRHRVRFASQAEIEQQQIMEGEAIWLPPGTCIFTAIKNVAPGARLRMFFRGAEGADTDLSEEMCRAIFEEAATPRTREIEAGLRTALEART